MFSVRSRTKSEFPNEYVVAVEAALGHNLQLVLTEQPESAQQILADLSANKKGRASIAALGIAEAPESRRRSNNAAESNCRTGCCDHAALCELIEADDSIQPLLQRLLGQTFIVA